MIASTGLRSNHLIGWIIFVILCKFVYSQQYAGDVCIIQRTNKTGKCKLLANCPQAIEDLRSQKLIPQTCGFEGSLPIVCCENSSSEQPPEKDIVLVRNAKQKCKEYADQYNIRASMSYVSGSEHRTIATCEHLFQPLIIQGNKARPKEFPHMAAVGYDGENKEKLWLCSGVLISENFVLTAAHCLSNRANGSPKYIRMGDLNLDIDNDDARPQEFNVAEIFIHPDFKQRSIYNDIGLLQLDKPVNFTMYARPACLNTNSTLPSQNAVFVAWGRELYTSDSNSHLLRETLKFVSHAKCERLFKNTTIGQTIKHGIVDETQVCAGLQNSYDTCGMGTGVLLSFNKERYCMYDVIGITSLGQPCGIVDYPGVFTRVSAYIPWIQEIVWPS